MGKNSLNNKDIKKYNIITSLNSKTKDIFVSLIYQAQRNKDSLKIVSKLNQNNIDYLVFKGITIQKFDKKRGFSDLDIFVEHKNVIKIIDILKKEFDYEANEKELNYFNKGYGFHIELANKNMIPVEVHYFLFDGTKIDENKVPILKDKISIQIDDIKIPCMSKEMQLLSILLHNIYNHRYLADYDRWIKDIKTIISMNLDWNYFLNIVRKLNESEKIYRTLRLLDLFNNKKLNIPENVRQELYNDSSKFRLGMTFFIEIYFCKKYPNNIQELQESNTKISRKTTYPALLLNLASLGFKKVKYLNTWKKLSH